MDSDEFRERDEYLDQQVKALSETAQIDLRRREDLAEAARGAAHSCWMAIKGAQEAIDRNRNSKSQKAWIAGLLFGGAIVQWLLQDGGSHSLNFGTYLMASGAVGYAVSKLDIYQLQVRKEADMRQLHVLLAQWLASGAKATQFWHLRDLAVDLDRIEHGPLSQVERAPVEWQQHVLKLEVREALFERASNRNLFIEQLRRMSRPKPPPSA